VKRLTVLGHPLHPPLVHLPISLLPLSFATQVWAFLSGEALVWKVAQGGLTLGLLAAMPALVTGFLDFLTIASNHPAERTAEWHMWTMASAIALFGCAWLIARNQNGPAWLDLALSAAGTLVLVVGGWLGGQLVYHFGVGRN
jgi:uncharacterized membrane protein